MLHALPLLLLSVWGLPADAESPRSTAERLLRVDGLARFRPLVKVGSFSSYDRTGGNDDGFSGKYSFLRKEGDGLVLAELKGPGAVTRVWTPTPTSDPLEFYFDGESTPRVRVPFVDLFLGKVPPFRAPLAYAGGGGYVSYVPLEFEKSVKVVIRAPKVQFYQINYALYEPGTPARTYRPGDAPAPPAPANDGTRVKGESVLQPGGTATLYETDRPGRITGLWVGPAEALAGPGRSVVLRMFWDGEGTPAVEVPVGDLFGASFGKPAARGLLLGTEDDRFYLRFPLPFDRAARVELKSDATSGPPITVSHEVLRTDRPRQADEGYFHATWRREDPTTPGKPFTFVDVNGRGHLVGVTVQAQGVEPGQTLFFEGDDQATIDGELVAHGTGSEDFFNGGWYDLPGRWYGRVSFPFSGCLEYTKPLARTGAYRLFVGDAYAFRRALKLTIEHGGEGNAVKADYTGVSHYYLDRAAGDGPRLPGADARRVHDPETFVIVPGWQCPIDSFSFDHATLTKGDVPVGRERLRCLSLRQTGPPVMQGHFVALTVEAPAAGRYAVSVEGVAGPEAGRVQVLLEDQPVGAAVDFYSAEPRKSGLLPLAELDLARGSNTVFLGMVGHNPKSTGAGFDLLRLVFRRTP